MTTDGARENIAIIQAVGVHLGGRGDDVLEAYVTVKGVSGPLAPFSASRYYSLRNESAAFSLETLMIETRTSVLEQLRGKVVKYIESEAGGLIDIFAIEGIYDNA